jgi:Gas vesicle synthesis protein GvpL/GvpF
MSDVHVHGVVAASAPVAVASVRRIEHDGLAALVSEIEPGAPTAAGALRSHWRVLEEVAARATVLPVRFGTVLPAGEVVDAFLAPRHDQLAAALAELDGKVQLTVKGFYDEEALMRRVVAESPAIADTRRRLQGVPEAATHFQRIELGRMVAAEVEDARRRDSAYVLERLAPLAVATSPEPPATAVDAVNAAFLVERARVDAFSRAVQEVDDELAGRIRLRYVGPLPPYSFSGEEEPAWA